jgi:hypothetical protein
MDRAALAPIASQMMKMALANLVNDGYVAFAIMIIGKDSTITPILIESPSKEATGRFLRTLSPHVDAIIIISEAWTLMHDDIDELAFAVPVSQHPKRVEGVFVNAQSPNGESELDGRTPSFRGQLLQSLWIGVAIPSGPPLRVE